MKQFDYKEFLKENKSTFHASLNENASNVARKFAQYMSKKEGKKFTVTPGSVDEKSFDLDLDGEEYMGGSYLVKDNGDIVNVAIGNIVAGNVNQLEEDDISSGDDEISDRDRASWGQDEYGDELYDLENHDDMYGLGDEDELEEGKKEYYKDAEADDAEHIKALEKDMEYDDEDLPAIDRMYSSDDWVQAQRDALEEGEDEEVKETKSSKMKVSELKAKIKEMILAEAEGDEEEVDAEAEATDDVTVDTGSEDIEVTDTETTAEVDPNVKAVQDALTQAQAAAQKLGDSKLTDQIGNTITFFTRAHVVSGTPKGAVAESLFPMLKKILK